jgi:hypothetical protein
VRRVEFNTNATPLLESVQMYLNRNDARLRSQGRFTASLAATFLFSWAARLQNALHIADVIEVTATKR